MVIVVGSYNLNALIFPSLRFRIVTDDATNLLSMLEERVCDRAAHTAGNSHHCEHVCCPLQIDLTLDKSGSAGMHDSLFH